ncbi:MAG: hypothetical protein RUDDFDWM_000323 [Candidatus Fervidibacterota bacterium]
MAEHQKRAPRAKKPPIETLEERLEVTRNIILRCMVGLLGREAVEHLVNAKKELLLAVRSVIDARIQHLDEATQRLKKIEVEGEEA